MAGVPIYSLNAVTIPTVGSAIDILPNAAPGYPPVIMLTLTGPNVGEFSTTVLVEGSHDNVNWVDFSAGGFTASDARDLIPGIRFWRANATIVNPGDTVTALVGAAPGIEGSFPGGNYATVAIDATQGQ